VVLRGGPARQIDAGRPAASFSGTDSGSIRLDGRPLGDYIGRICAGGSWWSSIRRPVPRIHSRQLRYGHPQVDEGSVLAALAGRVDEFVADLPARIRRAVARAAAGGLSKPVSGSVCDRACGVGAATDRDIG